MNGSSSIMHNSPQRMNSSTISPKKNFGQSTQPKEIPQNKLREMNSVRYCVPKKGVAASNAYGGGKSNMGSYPY